MNEYDLFIKLLDDDMIDFNAILVKYYKKLNINEKDVVVLSALIRQETKGNRNFFPSRLKQKVGLSKEDLFASLTKLTSPTCKFIEIKMEFNVKTMKDCEVFYLDGLYKEIVNLYLGLAKKENEKKVESFNEEISTFFEDTFNKQMGALDVDIIRRWGEEKVFSIDEIKNEILNAAKMGRTSLKYVDQALIKNKVMKEQSPEYKETNEIIEELKNKWAK